jgi:hypothetical protein
LEKNFDFFVASEKMQKKIIKDKEWLNGTKEKIAFFGAAAKGCVYLNSLGINVKNLPDNSSS